MADSPRSLPPAQRPSGPQKRETVRLTRGDTARLMRPEPANPRAAQPWNVAVFAPRLELDGNTLYALTLIRALADRGDRVALVSPDGALREAAAVCCVQWIGVPAHVGLFARRRLRQGLAEFQPDILHAITTEPQLHAVWAGDLLDRPVVVSVHGVKPGQLPDRGDTLFDAYVASDQAVRERLRNDCGIEAGRTTVLADAVHPARAPVEHEVLNPRKRPVVGWVSPLYAGCGAEVFVHSAQRVLQREPDCMFAILGDGPEAPAIRELVDRMQLAAHIVFVQHMYDYARVWETFDLSIIESRQPAAAVMVLQAMAHGLPVIATEGGAVYGVIEDGVDGLTVARDDADAMAERILLLVQNPRERLRMARAAFSRIEQERAPISMAEALSEVYAAVAAREPLPRIPDSGKVTRRAR